MSEESHIVVNKETRRKYDTIYVLVQRRLKRRMSYKEYMDWLANWAVNMGVGSGD